LAERTGSRRTYLEHRGQPRLERWLPSPTGIGIGMFIYLLPLASGMIAGEALFAVSAAIYLAAIG
jgi:hypothetical protein